ncbi:MAG: glycosyltransferase [Candidatus Eisenbacteria bacterium]|nr:glycosyltransferase [Candidatus Eisenbacteria bacterium]
MSQMRTLVIIPCKNLEGAVGDVVRSVLALELDLDALVVDDGSSDNTGDEAAKAGATVITHPVNMGKGEALRTGFEYAVENGYDAVVTMDGDGQHDPASIPDFVEALKSGDEDIVVGSRMHAVGDMPGLRIWTNRTTSRIVSRLARQTILDSQSGFRIHGIEVLADVTGSLVTSKYDTESEILIRAGRRGYRIGSIPIASIYHDSVSHIDPFVDTLRFVGLVVRSLFWR